MQENAIRDPKAMEIEAEVDRQLLCDTIVDYFNFGPAAAAQRSQLTTIDSSQGAAAPALTESNLS